GYLPRAAKRDGKRPDHAAARELQEAVGRHAKEPGGPAEAQPPPDRHNRVHDRTGGPLPGRPAAGKQRDLQPAGGRLAAPDRRHRPLRAGPLAGLSDEGGPHGSVALQHLSTYRTSTWTYREPRHH